MNPRLGALFAGEPFAPDTVDFFFDGELPIYPLSRRVAQSRFGVPRLLALDEAKVSVLKERVCISTLTSLVSTCSTYGKRIGPNGALWVTMCASQNGHRKLRVR